MSKANNDKPFTHTLTLSAQALTPYILHGVLLKVVDVFEAVSMNYHHFHQSFGDDVVEVRGHLKEIHRGLLNSLLDDISQRFHIDLAIQANRPTLRAPGLLVMDMDSTVIAIECIDEIAKLANVGDLVAEVTAKAMRGEIAFNESLVHRVACLEGVPQSHLSTIRDSLPIMPGIQTLLCTLRQHNWKLAIASGGFTYFADHLKTRLNLDYAISNVLAIEDGLLTGKVEGEIINADVKARTVNTLATQWGIPKAQTVAMGDGANDLVMMAEAGLGVACHGKPLVNEKADVAVRVGSLHRMLYFLDK
ncbi:phosphoserine phosphatase [Alteromonas sp. D210916BOD_24]